MWIFTLRSYWRSPADSYLYNRVDAGGNIPAAAANYNGKRFLSQVSDLRTKFDKTKEIDAYKRLQTVEEMRKLTAEGSEAFKGRFEKPDGAEEVKGGESAAKMVVKAQKGGKGWGKAEVTVRTGFEDAAALFWDVKRLGELSLSQGVKKTVQRKGKGFEMEVKTIEQAKKREFFSTMKLHKSDRESIIITTKPKERREDSEDKRDQTIRFMKIIERETS